MKRIKNYAWLLLPLLVLGACQDEQSGGFRFNLQKGKVYEFSRKYSVEQGGVLQSDIDSRFHVEVISDSNDVVKLSVTYDDFVVSSRQEPNAEGDSSRMLVSSPFSTEQLARAVYSSIKGKSFRLLIGRTGALLGSEGLKELVHSVVDTLPLPAAQRQMGQQMLDAFGASLISQNLSQGFDIFPDRPVKTGDSWQKEMQQGGGLLPIAVNTTYTVKDIRDGKVFLRVKALKSDNDQKGELLGDYIVEAKTGLVLEAGITTKFGNPVLISTSEKLTGKERQ